MNPNQTCEVLLSQIKNSNLNFNLSETPFSASVCIRKSFIRDLNGTIRAANIGVSTLHDSRLLDENRILENENKRLKEVLAKKEAEFETLSGRECLIQELDFKLQKCQGELEINLRETMEVVKKKEHVEKTLDDKRENIKVIENVIKTQNSKIQKLKDNESGLEKELKITEKQLNKINVKCENLVDNFENAKQENKSLKNKIKALEKNVYKLEKSFPLKSKKPQDQVLDKENNSEKKNKPEIPDSTQKTANQTSSTSTSASSILTTSFSFSPTSTDTNCSVSKTSSPNCSKPLPPTTPADPPPATTLTKVGSPNLGTPPRPLSPRTPPGTPPPYSRTTPATSSGSSLTSLSENKTSCTSQLNPTSQPKLNSQSPLLTLRLHPWNKIPIQKTLPLSSRCPHSVQCVLRQPIPPPFPLVTHLVNYQSNYHDRVMRRDPNRYGGHDRCFSVDHINYGCEDCVWLKWYGDLHGYPDINPWDFKKYMDAEVFADWVWGR